MHKMVLSDQKRRPQKRRPQRHLCYLVLWPSNLPGASHSWLYPASIHFSSPVCCILTPPAPCASIGHFLTHLTQDAWRQVSSSLPFSPVFLAHTGRSFSGGRLWAGGMQWEGELSFAASCARDPPVGGLLGHVSSVLQVELSGHVSRALLRYRDSKQGPDPRFSHSTIQPLSIISNWKIDYTQFSPTTQGCIGFRRRWSSTCSHTDGPVSRASLRDGKEPTAPHTEASCSDY